jgi:hypothetical protein
VPQICGAVCFLKLEKSAQIFAEKFTEFGK